MPYPIVHGCCRKKGQTTEYKLWGNMRNRCMNPNNKDYKHYGGRGITVCERWNSFPNFLADMGARPSPLHTIDRIDNNGPYAPDNCRWTTRAVQAANRRNARMLTYNGKTQCLSDWARETGINYATLHTRLHVQKLSAEEALRHT